MGQQVGERAAVPADDVVGALDEVAVVVESVHGGRRDPLLLRRRTHYFVPNPKRLRSSSLLLSNLQPKDPVER